MEGRMMTTDCAEIVYAVVRAELPKENKGRYGKTIIQQER
jgi:hypothetical protein